MKAEFNQPKKYYQLEEHKPNIENLYFRAFRAVDDRAACMKFVEGHTHVLEIFGITQITSAKIDWVLNPDVYVILVTSEKDGRALAGGRVHKANRKNPLPIEDAVGYMDDRIYQMVEERTDAGTAELAGLWNSWEIAGLGIGSMQLGTACVAYSDLLNLTTLFGLCAPDFPNQLSNRAQLKESRGTMHQLYSLMMLHLYVYDTLGLKIPQTL